MQTTQKVQKKSAKLSASAGDFKGAATNLKSGSSSANPAPSSTSNLDPKELLKRKIAFYAGLTGYIPKRVENQIDIAEFTKHLQDLQEGIKALPDTDSLKEWWINALMTIERDDFRTFNTQCSSEIINISAYPYSICYSLGQQHITTIVSKTADGNKYDNWKAEVSHSVTGYLNPTLLSDSKSNNNSNNAGAAAAVVDNPDKAAFEKAFQVLKNHTGSISNVQPELFSAANEVYYLIDGIRKTTKPEELNYRELKRDVDTINTALATSQPTQLLERAKVTQGTSSPCMRRLGWAMERLGIVIMLAGAAFAIATAWTGVGAVIGAKMTALGLGTSYLGAKIAGAGLSTSLVGYVIHSIFKPKGLAAAEEKLADAIKITNKRNGS